VPERAVVAAVQKIHQSIPKPYILAASLAAAAFYEWVRLKNHYSVGISASCFSFQILE